MKYINDSKILIGRSNEGNRLELAVYKCGRRASGVVSTMQPVPGSVSRLDKNNDRAHCSLVIDAKGNMTIANLKSLNKTFVDGMQIQQRSIDAMSQVMLGGDYYCLDLQSILAEAEILGKKILDNVNGVAANVGGGGGNQQTVDIRPLQAVWEEFEYEKDQISKRRKRLGIMMSISPIFTIGGAAIAGFANSLSLGKEIQTGMWIFSAIAFLFMVIVLVMRVKDNSEAELKQVTEKFLRNYHCPKCHKFVGNMPYFLIKEMPKCPGCGSKFIS
ncbi:MAG: FHA domain-containing protein [Prevotella sp.]|nr:FHA domain-containing protein [Bacteroides sp.]MCM1366421.1 FHA domain-containing protein [Prevotella sp.]